MSNDCWHGFDQIRSAFCKVAYLKDCEVNAFYKLTIIIEQETQTPFIINIKNKSNMLHS